jgi:hypothetical protein
MLAIKDFENYLLFYLERENCVDVIRVLHGARDVPEALHPKGGSCQVRLPEQSYVRQPLLDVRMGSWCTPGEIVRASS